MIKEYLYETYISLFEKIYLSKNKKQKEKIWNKIKYKTNILEYAIQINDKQFRANIIAYKILTDKSFWNTDLYKKIIDKIFLYNELAKTKINGYSFLILALENENLKLTKEQKKFLIFEAENCPHTEKYYNEKRNDETNMHGYGFRDLRYKILKNISFTIQEKTNLFMFFYKDDEIKLDILNEFEWEIAKVLGIISEEDYSSIYHLEENDIKKKIQDEKQVKEILDKITLCKNIYSKITEDEIQKYKNNF